MTLIDVHVHLSETKQIGAWSKDAYEIWEYGQDDEVSFGGASGDMEDLREAMGAGGVDHVVIVNAYSIDEWRGRWFAGFEHRGADTPTLGESLIEFNSWLVDAVAAMPDVTPFVAVDPWVLSPQQLLSHLENMRERGARGVKVHPIDQRFVVSDPRMMRIYEHCRRLDLAVLSHSGTSRGQIQHAEPAAFAAIAEKLPGLRLVVAHLGGGSWRQTRELADRYPDLRFDLSEIVAWAGAPEAPTETELVRLVRDVGVHRVMFGSDFPWYAPAEMAKAVQALPGLSDGEVAAILGDNAAEFLGVPA
jgi:predicted TIM-barrel fold metal-dependent hydrolase